MRIGWIVAAVATLGLAGCKHTDESASARAEYGQAKDDFSLAYDSVKRGAENTATAGKYALRDVGQGIVEVTDSTKASFDKAGGTVEDAWIKTKIESKYAMDKQVKMSDLKISSDHGTVRIVGLVDDPKEAERAIQLALDTDGVKAVDSNIQYKRAATPSPKTPY
jgi:osmotically-inducible protein OsmY